LFGASSVGLVNLKADNGFDASTRRVPESQRWNGMTPEGQAMIQSNTHKPFPAEFVWWKHGVVYQIYPRSFQDSNGDGVGDIQGVVQRLDYLQGLGVDALWLSPIYRSPMADFGYDLSDHIAINPLFGDMADFDALVREVHARGFKLILDYIPNHVSDQHRWFQASRSNRSNPRRDWFIWRDAAPDGGPPNNWQAEFGGAVWTRDATTGQYYYHAFLPAPDKGRCRRDTGRSPLRRK
jgi:glycosidase